MQGALYYPKSFAWTLFLTLLHFQGQMKLSLRVDHFVEYSRTGFGSPYKGLVIIQICLRKDRECFQTVF